MYEELEFRCEVCNDRRPDEFISVFKDDISKQFQLPPGTAIRNINHCNDRPACVNGAVLKAKLESERWKELGMGNTVAVDFDGTLCTNHAWVSPTHIEGPIEGAREFTEKLRELGLTICIHSCRTNPALNGPDVARAARDAMAVWLDKHGFVYDSIWMQAGKPIASAYVDDRGVSCRPVTEGPQAFDNALMMVKYLCGMHDEAVPGQ